MRRPSTRWATQASSGKSPTRSRGSRTPRSLASSLRVTYPFLVCYCPSFNFSGKAFAEFEQEYLTQINELLDKERDDVFKIKKDTNSWFEENDFEDTDIMNHLNVNFLSVNSISVANSQTGIFSQGGNTYDEDETEEQDDAQSFESEKSVAYSSLQNTGIFFGEDKLSEITVEIENADKYDSDEAENLEAAETLPKQATTEDTAQTVSDLLEERDKPSDSS